MADNYSEMSIAFTATEEQAQWLLAAWEAMNTFGTEPAATPPEGLSLGDWDYPPCSMNIGTLGNGQNRVWLYSEENVDAEGLTRVLQQFLKHFDREDGIGIEAAMICSKPRIGQFGGFAIWVTKDAVEAWSTGGWLSKKEREHSKEPDPDDSAVSEPSEDDLEPAKEKP